MKIGFDTSRYDSGLTPGRVTCLLSNESLGKRFKSSKSYILKTNFSKTIHSLLFEKNDCKIYRKLYVHHV